MGKLGYRQSGILMKAKRSEKEKRNLICMGRVCPTLFPGVWGNRKCCSYNKIRSISVPFHYSKFAIIDSFPYFWRKRTLPSSQTRLN